MTTIIVASIYTLGKILSEWIASRRSGRLERKINVLMRDVRALKAHAGIEVDDEGKVLILRRSAAAAAEYQDELAPVKP